MRALLAIVALGAGLRFATLDVQSYWLDEAVTALLLDQGLGGVLSDIPDSESTPPLYYVLAWLWSKLFGLGEVGLRSLSALLGTATIAVAYVAARDLVSARAGLVAAALVATNPLLVWYSQEARSYALLVLLTAATLPLLRRGRLGAWAVVATLALATHYFALFVVVPEALWLLARRRGRRGLAAVGLPALAGAALLPLAVDQAGNEGAHFIEGSSLGFRLAQVPKQFLVGFDAPGEVVLTVAAGLLALVGALLLLRKARSAERRGALAAAAVGAAAIGVPLALALIGPDYVITRNVIAAVIPLAVALAAGLAATRAGVAAAAGLCAIGTLAVVAVALEPRSQRDDWRGVAEALGPPVRDRIIVATPPEAKIPLRVYLPGLVDASITGATAPEVNSIGIARRRAGEPPDPPRGMPPAPPGGFRQVERIEEPTFTIVRFLAPQPAPLDPPGAESAKLVPEVGAVLFQPAAR